MSVVAVPDPEAFGGLRQCSGKRAYASKREARAMARRRAKHAERRLKYYKCLICGAWHLAKVRPQDDEGDRL